ncbi:hypothetical protein ABT337_11040 [Saccharopolyspora hirsuta]|uniref:hypothetical protein n=1 Tax=Saccharopolyspora hirsuta TaxID=1837 RepID=UPI003329F017
MTEQLAEATRPTAQLTPPARRGSREERRAETLRALGSGEEAHCAYCGDRLPPLPPRGGRPTPYCPADPERYGQWGAKTITCAMLDEHREIWVQTYGPDQPMTQLDVHALDERLNALQAVLNPVQQEISALQSHATEELSAALAARETAEAERREAVEAARAAEAARDEALAQAADSREEAEAARIAKDAAIQRADEAAAARDQAIAEQASARQEAEAARTDRQQALDQVAAAHQRIDDLQATLASERASALEQLDLLRREEQQTRQDLRTALTEEWRQRLDDQAEDFAQRLQDAQTRADQRIADLSEQLTRATENYATALAPLHEKISALRNELAAQTSFASRAHQQLDQLRDRLAEAVENTSDAEALREHIRTVLAHTAVETPPPGNGESP